MLWHNFDDNSLTQQKYSWCKPSIRSYLGLHSCTFSRIGQLSHLLSQYLCTRLHFSAVRQLLQCTQFTLTARTTFTETHFEGVVVCMFEGVVVCMKDICSQREEGLSSWKDFSKMKVCIDKGLGAILHRRPHSTVRSVYPVRIFWHRGSWCDRSYGSSDFLFIASEPNADIVILCSHEWPLTFFYYQHMQSVDILTFRKDKIKSNIK